MLHRRGGEEETILYLKKFWFWWTVSQANQSAKVSYERATHTFPESLTHLDGHCQQPYHEGRLKALTLLSAKWPTTACLTNSSFCHSQGHCAWASQEGLRFCAGPHFFLHPCQESEDSPQNCLTKSKQSLIKFSDKLSHTTFILLQLQSRKRISSLHARKLIKLLSSLPIITVVQNNIAAILRTEVNSDWEAFWYLREGGQYSLLINAYFLDST